MCTTPIGIQLYALADNCRSDLASTLSAVVKIGFTGVELFHENRQQQPSGVEMRRMLARAGLRAIGYHASYVELLDEADSVIAYCRDAGIPRIISVEVPESVESAEDYRRYGQFLLAIGDKAAEQGLTLAHHTEPRDFTPLEGRTALGWIMSEAPASMTIEFDTMCALIGGQDPVAGVMALRDSISLVHLKDHARDDEEPIATDWGPMPSTEVGTGVIDFARIIDEVGSGLEWLIIEQDAYKRPPLESALVSYRNTAALLASRA